MTADAVRRCPSVEPRATATPSGRSPTRTEAPARSRRGARAARRASAAGATGGASRSSPRRPTSRSCCTASSRASPPSGRTASRAATSCSSRPPRSASPASPPAPASRSRRSSPTCASPSRSSPAGRCSSPPPCRSSGCATRRAGREPRRPADQDRGQSRAPGEPRRARDVFAQASVLGLYDPDRSQTVVQLGRIATWSELLSRALGAALAAQAALGGAGLRLLTGTVTSPTEARRDRRRSSRAYPQARWHRWDPLAGDAAHAGAVQAPSARRSPALRLSPRPTWSWPLDSDFLAAGPGAVRYARDFAARRSVALRKRAGR